MAATQNTLIVIDDTTIATNIKPALLDELKELSQATGKSLSWMMNRSINMWLDMEGPVYAAHAEEKRVQKV